MRYGQAEEYHTKGVSFWSEQRLVRKSPGFKKKHDPGRKGSLEVFTEPEFLWPEVSPPAPVEIFYCHEELLVVEIDGDLHKDDYQSERDDNRTAELESLGIRVVRFTNSQVLKDINGVLQKLKQVVG